MDRDLHDDCLRILRTKADLTDNERRTLSYTASRLAAGEDLSLPDRRAARGIVWSYHSQGTGRPAPTRETA